MKRGLKRKSESFGSYSLANKKINMAARVIQVTICARGCNSIGYLAEKKQKH
jgi:hypothetical protein